MARVTITGAAGFIGSHLTRRLANTHELTFVDSLTTSYGGNLVRDRADSISHLGTLHATTLQDCPLPTLDTLVERSDLVVHLAAWAGVRTSLAQSAAYFNNNVAATAALLDASARTATPILLVSSSSVYGDRGADGSCSEEMADGIGLRSPYATSKWMMEEWTRSIADRLPPLVVARPFSIYGPWGRPDMAYFAFGRRILRGEPIRVFGDVHTRRDFTYIDDAIFYLSSIVEMMLADDARLASELPVISGVPTVNICNGDPHSLLDVISGLEQALGRSATINFEPASDLDLRGTHGDPSRLHQLCGVRKTPLFDGLDAFANWMTTFQGKSRDW